MTSAPIHHATDSKLSDGRRTSFRNVIVLAQPRSLDDCVSLPSILNSLAANCAKNSGELSAADIAYLTGLYRITTDRLLAA